jgi:hypothetical protein
LPDDLTDFDGAAALLRAWSRGIRPDPDLTVSEWADRHRWLSSRASAEPGRYRTARTPYMREIMDRLSPGDPMQRVVFMKAAQDLSGRRAQPGPPFAGGEAARKAPPVARLHEEEAARAILLDPASLQ